MTTTASAPASHAVRILTGRHKGMYLTGQCCLRAKPAPMAAEEAARLAAKLNATPHWRVIAERV